MNTTQGLALFVLLLLGGWCLWAVLQYLIEFKDDVTDNTDDIDSDNFGDRP